MPVNPDALDAVLAEYRTAWTPTEVATEMGVHVTTVHRLIKSGKLRTISCGAGEVRRTLVKVPRSAVSELLQADPRQVAS